MTVNQPSLFDVGQVLVNTSLWTDLAQAMDELSVLKLLAQCLDRHRVGDWGDVDPEDWTTNQDSVASGGRLLSAYNVADRLIWVVTEGDRSTTTLLKPEDY